MKKFQNKYRIESTRLKYWDYSNPGMYFITICTHNFVEWFGTINDRKLGLNAMGDIAEKCWIEIPNHIPGIICIVETRHAVSLQENKNKFGP